MGIFIPEDITLVGDIHLLFVFAWCKEDAITNFAKVRIVSIEGSPSGQYFKK